MVETTSEEWLTAVANMFRRMSTPLWLLASVHRLNQGGALLVSDPSVLVCGEADHAITNVRVEIDATIAVLEFRTNCSYIVIATQCTAVKLYLEMCPYLAHKLDVLFSLYDSQLDINMSVAFL